MEKKSYPPGNAQSVPQVYIAASLMDCQTEGVLYKLDCTVQGCNEICYVGESMKRAEERFVGHLNSINLDCYENSNLPVAHHFRTFMSK